MVESGTLDEKRQIAYQSFLFIIMWVSLPPFLAVSDIFIVTVQAELILEFVLLVSQLSSTLSRSGGRTSLSNRP